MRRNRRRVAAHRPVVGCGFLPRYAAKLALCSTLLACIGCNDTERAAPDEPEVVAPDPGKTGFAGWQHAKTHSFAIEMESALGFEGGQVLLSFDLEAALELDVRRVGEELYEFLLTIPDVRFRKTSQPNDPKFDELAAELKRPFGFRIEHGKLRSVQVDKQWSSFAASIARTIAAAYQIPEQIPTTEQPPQADQAAKSWEVTEVDTTGDYRVKYELTQQGLSKKKLEYTDLKVDIIQFGTLKARLSPKIKKSSGTLNFDAKGRLVSFEYEEGIDTPMNGVATLLSKTKLTMRRIEGGSREVRDFKATLSNHRDFDASEPYTGPINTDYTKLRIGGYTYETALAEIRRQQTDPKNRSLLAARNMQKAKSELEKREQQSRLQKRAQVFRAMQGILASQPQHVPDAVREVRAKGPAARTLIDALSAADTPEAVAALTELLQDKTISTDWRAAVSSGLVRADHVSPEAVEALQDTLSEPQLRVYALYGLGTIARRLREDGESSRSEAIVAVLVRELQSSSASVSTVVQPLRGLANAGSASALNAVLPHLKSESETVRGAAVAALRLMDESQVDSLLVEALLNDKKKSVRRAAGEAIALRKPSSVLTTGVQNAVTSDPDVKLREQLLKLVIDWLPDRPELQTALEAVAKDDRRESLRRDAAEALERAGKG